MKELTLGTDGLPSVWECLKITAFMTSLRRRQAIASEKAMRNFSFWGSFTVSGELGMRKFLWQIAILFKTKQKKSYAVGLVGDYEVWSCVASRKVG